MSRIAQKWLLFGREVAGLGTAARSSYPLARRTDGAVGVASTASGFCSYAQGSVVGFAADSSEGGCATSVVSYQRVFRRVGVGAFVFGSEPHAAGSVRAGVVTLVVSLVFTRHKSFATCFKNVVGVILVRGVLFCPVRLSVS